MTELSFLVDLLLNHKLPKVTRDAVAVRIKEVESSLPMQKQIFPQAHFIPPHHTGVISPAAMQAPSTLAAMARHGDLQMIAAPEMPPIPSPEPAPVTVIAQTPATAMAMNSRNQAIADSINGKTDKLTGRPRKF